MKKWMTLIGLSLLMGGNSIAQSQQSLLWEVKSPQGKISYLFGTYHLVGSDYLKGHQKVKKAFEHAQTIVVETVIDSSAMLQVSMAAMMPDHSLKELLDSSDYFLIKQELEPIIGYDLSMLDHMKPMMLSTMYSMAIAEQATPKELEYEGEPMDLYFEQNGREKGKTVVALETPEEQAQILFNSQSVQEQADDLVEMVKQSEETEQLSEGVIKAYQDEDLNAMWEEANESDAAHGDMDVLLNNRNKAWIKKLKPVLDSGQAFIAVGALHLPGEEGLLALLTKEGYTLTAVVK